VKTKVRVAFLDEDLEFKKKKGFYKDRELKI
jgi:hypothetical protein